MSKLSLSTDSCLQSDSVNLKDTGNKQTGRKVRVHLVSQLKVQPVTIAATTTGRGALTAGGSGQGRNGRLEHKVSMNSTVGNQCLTTTNRDMYTRKNRCEATVTGFEREGLTTVMKTETSYE